MKRKGLVVILVVLVITLGIILFVVFNKDKSNIDNKSNTNTSNNQNALEAKDEEIINTNDDVNIGTIDEVEEGCNHSIVDNKLEDNNGYIKCLNGKMYYYSKSSNKKLYDGKYKDLSIVNDKYLTGYNSNEEDENQEAFLLDRNTEKIYLQDKSDDVEWKIYYKEVDGNIVLYHECHATCSDKIGKVYTKHLKILASENFEYTSLNNGFRIWKYGTNIVNEYDLNSKNVKTIDKYKKILGIANSYILFEDNNVLKLVDNNDKIIEIIKMNNNEEFYYMNDSKKQYINIYIIDKSLSIDDYWNNCKKTNDCEYESLNEMKDALGGIQLGYAYSYDYVNNKITKEIIYFD